MSSVVHLTTEEVAVRLRLKSPQTLRAWRRLRKGPPFRKFGSRVLYPEDKLVEWEQRQEVATT